MSKRLQVLLDDEELAGIQEAARRQRMTTAEWVRQAMRAAKRAEPRGNAQKKLETIRAAARHSYPAPDVEQMLREIEHGYVGDLDR